MKLFAFSNDDPFWQLPPPTIVAEAGAALGATSDSGMEITLRRLAPPRTTGSPVIDPAQVSPPLVPAPAPNLLLTLRAPLADEGTGRDALACIDGLAAGTRAFSVDEFVAVAGEPTDRPTVSRVGLIRRPDGTTVDEFWRHWTGRHVPMVLAQGPLFSRYIPNLVLTPEQPWDGVVEQWFLDVATWNEHDRQIREEKPEIAADIANFIGRFMQWETTELARTTR
jgi:hypothetical protein